MVRPGRRTDNAESLPVRGAWIEILLVLLVLLILVVAPRAGSVD